MRAIRVDSTPWLLGHVSSYLLWAVLGGCIVADTVGGLGGAYPLAGIIVVECLFLVFGAVLALTAPFIWLVGPETFGWVSSLGRRTIVPLSSITEISMSGKGTMLEIKTTRRTVRADYHWLSSNRLLLDLLEELAKTSAGCRMERGVARIAEARELARRALLEGEASRGCLSARQAVYDGRLKLATRLYSRTTGLAEVDELILKAIGEASLPYAPRRSP